MAVAACMTGLATAAGFASYDAFLGTGSSAGGLLAPIGWWLLAVPLAIATTAILRFRRRATAAVAWIGLAAVLALAGRQAREESARPPAGLTTDSDVPSVLFLLLCLVCWAAAILVGVAGPVLALFPAGREQPPRREAVVTRQR